MSSNPPTYTLKMTKISSYYQMPRRHRQTPWLCEVLKERRTTDNVFFISDHLTEVTGDPLNREALWVMVCLVCAIILLFTDVTCQQRQRKSHNVTAYDRYYASILHRNPLSMPLYITISFNDANCIGCKRWTSTTHGGGGPL